MKHALHMPFSIIHFLMDLLEALLVLRFLFKLIAATTGNWLLNMLYAITQPFISPFQSILAPTVTGNVTIEWATVFAMVGYALLAALLLRVLVLLLPEDDDEPDLHSVSHHAL